MLKLKKMLVAGMMIANMFLSGCTSHEPEKPQSVSIVMGVHEYFPLISLTAESIYSKIYDACYSYGNCSVVVIDGLPYVACNYNINRPKKRIDSAKRAQLASKNASQIITEMTEFSAKAPEIDTLSGISVSSDALRSTAGDNERTMLIFDSGLSTTSLLDFSEQNLINMPVENIVKQLEELHAIPDLAGIEVLWIGLGQTCGEQTPLTPDYKYKLRNIWQGILEAGGAVSVTFDTSPLSADESIQELPECSTVPIVVEGLDPSVAVTKAKISAGIKWDERSPLRFEGDKADFVDEAAAREELKPVSLYLNSHPEDSVYIFGMTATMTGGDLGLELAEDRAEACKRLLLELGAEESQLLTVGLGQIKNPLRVDDVDDSGMQIEELAQKNRAVVVVTTDSEVSAKLLKCRSDFM